MSMDDPTPLSQYGAAALLAVLAQSLRHNESPHPLSPLVLAERMIADLRNAERKQKGDEEAIATLKIALRYFYVAEQVSVKE